MARYIDADALLKKQTTIRATYHCQGADEWDDYEVVLVKDINNAPTISPDEVRGMVHGTWVGIDDFPHESWECDRCGCVVENTDDPWNYFHYCPNCGARMKGAEDGTTD